MSDSDLSGSQIPNEFTANTSFGLFKVKITNRTYITIGSKHACVQIGYTPATNKAKLDWLGTEQGGCEETDKTIHGNDTTSMADLGFTILRKLYPDVHTWITLRDSSTFKCKLFDGNHVPISTMKYILLLYGETYYQNRFKAVPVYDEAVPAYTTFYNAWNSDKLPPDFLFNNDELSDIFIPIYKTCSTWREFFEKIYKKYNRTICTLIHSWYLDVYGSLAKVPITTDWKIDLTTRPMIPFEITSKNNSKNFTRKSFHYDPFNFSGGYYPMYMKYKDYVRSNRPNKTRKQN